MIIRKPYAFLIKNFRKIHILLLVLCFYIYFISINLRSFVSNFITLGTYDSYLEPITKYVNFLSFFSLLIIIVIFIVLALLLRYKNKPWKLYLIPIIEYISLLFLFISVLSFFNTYDGYLESTRGIRAIKDLLLITSLVNYPIFILLIVRIIGLDLNKFGFKNDKEFLELNSEDREEVEINIDIDKESFKRLYRRFLRNVGYVYKEHKFIINSLIFIFVILLSIGSYRYFFVINKVYKEGEVLNANGYSISINNVYYTDKDGVGNVVEKNSAFVILDVNVANNGVARKIDFNKFHIINGISDYTYTSKTYSDSFNDFGKIYDTYELKRGENKRFILVFKVSKKLDINKYVLYYQEINGYNNTYLRKIKVNVNNLSKIKLKDSKKLGEEIIIKKDTEFDFILESYEFLDKINYKYESCKFNGCELIDGESVSKPNCKIMEISFSSSELSGEDMIDFSSKYGKIIYKDRESKDNEISIINQVNIEYYGKYLYLKVPNDIVDSSSIKFTFTVRNNKYEYTIR